MHDSRYGVKVDEVILDKEGVLRIKGRICVLRVDD